MAQVTSDLDFDTILAAIKRLPKSQKLQIWQSLDAELNREEINREFVRALEEIWIANAHFSEAEVNADIATAIQQVRSETMARRS